MPEWRNRISGSGTERPADLLANPRNWRIHPKNQQEALAGALDQVGWVQQVIVNNRTGHLLDGHLRAELAIARGESSIPVVYVDLSEEEEALVLASLDPISGMAVTDQEQLSQLLAEVSFDSRALEDALRGLAPAKAEGLTDPDAVPEVDETEVYVKPGDLWLLGDHRLLCGDSTDAEDVARLLDGERPRLTVTDPPYGVGYDPAWRDRAATDGKIDYAERRTGRVANDDRADWTDAWRLSPSDVFYVWHSWLAPSSTLDALAACDIDARMHIVWAKPRPVISRGHYNGQHECCWYGVRAGRSAEWVGGHAQSSLWEIKGDPAAGDHGTQKPVECMARPIRNHRGDVYEPFSGSGTTIIAAEQLGRRCYAMELEPRYVQVAIERWQQFTGKEAIRDGSQRAGTDADEAQGAPRRDAPEPHQPRGAAAGRQPAAAAL